RTDRICCALGCSGQPTLQVGPFRFNRLVIKVTFPSSVWVLMILRSQTDQLVIRRTSSLFEVRQVWLSPLNLCAVKDLITLFQRCNDILTDGFQKLTAACH